MMDVIKLIGFQSSAIIMGGVLDKLVYIWKNKLGESKDYSWALGAVYTYGYIQGIRAERAKRKGVK